MTQELKACPDEDWFEEVISDSLDMDWRPRDAAKAIVNRWSEAWYSENTRTPDSVIAELVEALRPFANMKYSHNIADGPMILRAEWFDAAQSALAKLEASK